MPGEFPDCVPNKRQMKVRTKRALQFACYAIVCSLAFAGDDDEAPKPGDASQTPSLNAEQQRAVNLQVAHPVAVKVPERTTALGVVLDATSLLSDASERAVAEAQEQAVSAEASRLRGLYKAGAGTSLKMLETAQAEEAKARAEADLAAARFAQHWGPLAEGIARDATAAARCGDLGAKSAGARRFAGAAHPRRIAGTRGARCGRHRGPRPRARAAASSSATRRARAF